MIFFSVTTVFLWNGFILSFATFYEFFCFESFAATEETWWSFKYILWVQFTFELAFWPKITYKIWYCLARPNRSYHFILLIVFMKWIFSVNSQICKNSASHFIDTLTGKYIIFIYDKLLFLSLLSHANRHTIY